MSYAKVSLIGNLGRDPEVRFTPDGRALAKTSIAVTRKTKAGEETDWYRITFGGKLGEIAGEYLKKGRQVYVEGRLKLNKYTDRDGVERHSLDVDATELQMLGTREGMGRPTEEGGGSFGAREQGAGGGQRESTAGSRPGAARAPTGGSGGSGGRPGGGLGPEDDDIPF
jgi:single-strand DNA-binding protein